MVGLQATVFKTQLGPLLNGFVNYDFWLPLKTMEFPGVIEFIKKYQARAQPGEGVDPLGYYIAPWGYAYLQVLGQAVEATKSLDDSKLIDYMHNATFKTVLGDVKFGKGENGPNRACCRSNSKTLKVMASNNSRTYQLKRSWHRRNINREILSIRTPMQINEGQNCAAELDLRGGPVRL